MPYTSNPHMGITRRKAIDDVLTGRRTQAEAARYYGFTRSAICKWLKRKPKYNRQYIETKLPTPKRFWNQTSNSSVARTIELRKKTGRCAQIIHAVLQKEDIKISLSTVTRILRRHKLTRKKRQTKPPYARIPRPLPEKPGTLVEMDTIHFIKSNGTRFYIYAVIDVCSRYAYAEYSRYLSAKRSTQVARNAQKEFSFRIKTIQTDNGSEFSEYLYFQLRAMGVYLRHTRPRKPNDNAHVERFIRTIQEEGFKSMLPDESTIKSKLKEFINYYNNERYHLGINCNTPCSVVSKLLT